MTTTETAEAGCKRPQNIPEIIPDHSAMPDRASIPADRYGRPVLADDHDDEDSEL